MIHIVIGTRAQLLKMAPVMRELTGRGLPWRWIYTAQHRETIDEIREVFELPPADQTVFDWQSEAKTMGKLWYWLGRMVLALPQGRRLLHGHTGPAHVVVTHGDTLTTLWAAILGRLYRCGVMHVEAGFRSGNLFRPFPEEIVRLLTSWLAHTYACPGSWTIDNLRRFRGHKFDIGANTQLDTLRFGLTRSESAAFERPQTPYVVASIHRAETILVRSRLELVVDLLELVASDFPVLFILHPSTEARLRKFGLLDRLSALPGIRPLPRLDYLSFIKAIRYAEFVVTDGGGNHEELSHLGKPTILLRSETEWPQGLRETAVLSKFDRGVVGDFLRGYKQYDLGVTTDESQPSKIIVDALEEMTAASGGEGERTS